MSDSEQESELYKYFKDQVNNINSQEDLNYQSQTSENMSVDESSDHDETPNSPKPYETQKLVIINELTQKERTNYTTIGNGVPFENDSRHQPKEVRFLGKKTSGHSIPEHELDMEQVSEIAIEALTNEIQFLKVISSNLYGCNLDFKIDKDLIKQKGFIEKNLDKTIKEILLMKQNIDPQEKESIKNKIKSLLEIEYEQKDNFLPYCKNIFRMNLKGLLSNYVNDRSDKISGLNNLKLKTLKDNPKYSDEEKTGIRKQILTYLESQKRQTSCMNDLLIGQNQLINHSSFYHELNFNQLLPNLSLLPNEDINEENLSPENIDSVNQIENNQERNYIENNQEGNYIENNEIENNIENNEVENNIENNEVENHIENNQTENLIGNNQTGNNNNIITESQEPNETGQKLDDKENNKPKGGRIDNQKRKSINKSFDSLTEMINKIANAKLTVHINNDISGNSSEKFQKFLKKKIGEIYGRKNKEFVESILKSNDTSKEIQFLKNLFEKECSKIIEIFIDDTDFSFTKSNGDSVKFKTITEVIEEKFKNRISEIRQKINKILNANGRLRAKSQKKKEKIIIDC